MPASSDRAQMQNSPAALGRRLWSCSSKTEACISEIIEKTVLQCKENSKDCSTVERLHLHWIHPELLSRALIRHTLLRPSPLERQE
jgi:hypothetical protein